MFYERPKINHIYFSQFKVRLATDLYLDRKATKADQALILKLNTRRG